MSVTNVVVHSNDLLMLITRNNLFVVPFQDIFMQTLSSSGIDFVGLVTAIGSIVIAVGSISHSLAQRPELKAHKEGLQSVADLLGDIGNHVIASKEEMNDMAEVVYANLPDGGRSIVNKQAIRLAELQKKLETAQEQLGKIPPALDHI